MNRDSNYFMGSRNIEVCCTSVNDVLEAWYGGAVRVELCSAISCGGVTPSYGLISDTVRIVKELLHSSDADGSENAASDTHRRFAVNVLIRPREGEFCYSAAEIDTMISDIRFCSEVGVDGVVIGALTPEGNVDMNACRRLVDAADGMSITFHRAFDACLDPFDALEKIIALGCDRLLTSGQRSDALKGSELIRKLVAQSGGRISIMPGSGIKSENILEIERITGANEFHSTARYAVPDLSRRHVPELGFEEPSVKLPASFLDDQCNDVDDNLRYVMRTSRDVVRQLVERE